MTHLTAMTHLAANTTHLAANITHLAANILTEYFTFENYGELVVLLQNSLIAAALLGVVGGLISVFVMARDIAFAVHGVAELSFAGASFALLISFDVVYGSIIGSLLAALVIGVGGARSSEKNTITGVLMPFGLGLGILFLALYDGRAANKFGLLTGQIVAINASQIRTLVICAIIVLMVLLIVWRPLTFASIDPAVARAKGVPVTALTIIFMLALGLAVALSVQVVGVLLVLALLVTPAAAATQVSASPILVPVLSMAFAVTASVGGILIALGSPVVPISPFVTTISFLIYLICRLIGRRRKSRHTRARIRREADIHRHPSLTGPEAGVAGAAAEPSVAEEAVAGAGPTSGAEPSIAEAGPTSGAEPSIAEAGPTSGAEPR